MCSTCWHINSVHREVLWFATYCFTQAVLCVHICRIVCQPLCNFQIICENLQSFMSFQRGPQQSLFVRSAGELCVRACPWHIARPFHSAHHLSCVAGSGYGCLLQPCATSHTTTCKYPVTTTVTCFQQHHPRPHLALDCCH